LGIFQGVDLKRIFMRAGGALLHFFTRLQQLGAQAGPPIKLQNFAKLRASTRLFKRSGSFVA
jgi:hypothetical protein